MTKENISPDPLRPVSLWRKETASLVPEEYSFLIHLSQRSRTLLLYREYDERNCLGAATRTVNSQQGERQTEKNGNENENEDKKNNITLHIELNHKNEKHREKTTREINAHL